MKLDTIYHEQTGPRGEEFIRLNLKAVRELMDVRDLDWEDIGDEERSLLERRFSEYLKFGRADFRQGSPASPAKDQDNTSFSIEHLPNKLAIERAKKIR